MPASAHFVVVDPALWVEPDLSTERRPNHVYIADRAVLYELNHALDLWVAAIHEGFHQEHIVFHAPASTIAAASA